jgi:peptide/nickel transport system substrate-binding protein
MVKYRLLAAGAVLAIVATACSSAASPTAAPASQAPATQAPATQAPASVAPSESAAAPSESAAAGTPKDGGTLVVGLPGDMVLADPTLVSDSNSSYIQQNVIEGLVGLKPGTTSELIPVLAESLPTASADGLTYTFKIRQGVKFHDGTPLDAAAVVYNWERQKNTPEALRDAYNYYFGAVFGWADKSNVKSVVASDPSTVVITLGVPQSNFLLAQTLPQFGIQSPTALKAGDADNPDPSKSPYAQGQGGTGKSMVGTGPFMFKEWTPNDHVTIVKNPDYWDAAGMAHLDAITYKPYADQTAELNALQAGDIDFAQTIAPNDVATVAADTNLQVIDRGASCNIGLLQMNHTYKPFDNLQIRQAIGYALNKQSYIDAFYAGLAQPADNYMPASAAYYKPLGLPTYDPQKAKDLIAASGVPADQLKLTFYYPSDVARPYMPDPKGLAEAIARDLEAVGFTITFKTEGWRTGYLADEAVGKFPMWLLGWTCDWAGPDNFLVTAFFHFDGDKPNPEFAYGPPELNAAFKAGLAATSDAEAAAAWGQAQDILAKDLPTVPLVNSKPPAAAKADVKGFIGAGNLTELMNTVWLDR